MPSLRLGQITDLHARSALPGASWINKRRSREMFELFPQALKQMREAGVQFVAVTGDLLDVPDYAISPETHYPYDYQVERFRAEAVDDYRALKRMLDECGVPYAVLPGNHDHEPSLWQVFDRNANVEACGDFHLIRFCDREGDSHVPRRLDRERKLWERALKDGSMPRQIHLQHYVVTPDLSQGYPHTYLEGEHIRHGTVASGRVVLSVSGHYHSGTDLIQSGRTTFTTCEAFCDFPHRYRIYEVSDHGVRFETHSMRMVPQQHRKAGAFLDRDGVVTRLQSYDTGPEAMEVLPGAAKAIMRLRQAGYAVIIITNQSAIGMGYVTPSTVLSVNDRMCRLLREEGGELAQPDAIYFSVGASKPVHACFGDISDCKPAPVLLQRAAEQFGVDMSRAFFAGDRDTDVRTAWNANVQPVLVRTGDGRITEDWLSTQKSAPPVIVADDLEAAVKQIIQ